MEKKCLSYLPARIRKGANRWDIIYYQTPPDSPNKIPYRLTFGINRIKNLREREKTARRLVKKINAVLHKGYPFSVDIEGNSLSEKSKPIELTKEKLTEKNKIQELESKIDFLISIIQTNSFPIGSSKTKRENKLSDTLLSECIEKARAIKTQTAYRTTKRSYNSHAKLFVDYLEKNNMEYVTIGDFQKREAIEYLDWWSMKGITNNTWNNKLNHIRALFTELVKRQYIKENPFSGISPKAASKVSKDCLTIVEMKTLAQNLKKHNIWLYWAVNFAYYLLIRQEELARIKFNFFDLKRGILHLPADVTKNKQEAYLTVPKFLLKEMIQEGFFSNNYQNWYVFGKGLKPNASDKIGERALNKSHRKCMLKMQKSGFVIRKGVSFASWRKTGFNDYGELLNPKEQDEMFRHLDPRIKLVYFKKKQIIETVRDRERAF